MSCMHKMRNVKAKLQGYVLLSVYRVPNMRNPVAHIDCSKSGRMCFILFIFSRYKLKIIYICEISLVLIHRVFLLIRALLMNQLRSTFPQTQH